MRIINDEFAAVVIRKTDLILGRLLWRIIGVVVILGWGDYQTAGKAMKNSKYLLGFVAAGVVAIASQFSGAGDVAAEEQRVFEPGPIITFQLANMDELCGAYNLDQYGSTRNFIRAITLNIRLMPGDDKSEKIMNCVFALEAAAFEGRIPNQLLDLAIGWVQTSCTGMAENGILEISTCSRVREIRDSYMNS